MHLGCNKEVGGLLRWLLPQVSLEGVWRERRSNYRFGKPHQLAIDGTMPANIKKFLGGDLFGAGWGIPGLPLMNSILYEAPATPYPLQDLRFKREALSAMEAFKHMTANNDGWVVEKNEVSE